MQSDVSLFEITQATTATFTDLYIELTFFFFIEVGSKRVVRPRSEELIGEEGDLMIFPAGAMVTMENRPVLDRRYRAVGVSFSDALIEEAFPPERALLGFRRAGEGRIQLVRRRPYGPAGVLARLRETLASQDLPDEIRRHRLLEPLIWLRHHGFRLTARRDEQPFGKVRRILETDLSRPWRAAEVAGRMAMSEATMRRVLARSGQGFSRILLNTRLERGLTRLQTTDVPISEIALEVGFKTPSHFADAFKKRFGISPRQVRTREA